MDVTINNFNEHFKEIQDSLKQCCFVSFDAEFTAILSKDCFSYRLFDTNEIRYNKIKTEISSMIMSQIGLTMFAYDRNKDTYIGTGYTFHLCPQQFGDVDQKFIFQASTLKFLCKYKFDFNKFIYNGIPYLNRNEENQIRQILENYRQHKRLNFKLEMNDEATLQNYCSEASKWLTQSEENTMYIDVKDPVMRFLTHTELRNRFPDIYTTDSLGNSNMVLLYKNKDVEGATQTPLSELEENLINHLLGFSRIFNLLVKYKKPIVGHNVSLDLMLLHNQFIGALPKKYSDFKKNIIEVLPLVHDSKYISYEMGKKLSFDDTWPSNALQDLYEFFHNAGNLKYKSFIEPLKPFNHKQSYHEAGWDSYVTGYCFIRLGQWAARLNSGSVRPVSPTEMFAALSPYCNRVNVIRGAVPYMNLTGEDPAKHRPKIVYVRTINGDKMNYSKMECLLANHGTVDIKPFGAKAALVAASTQFTVDKIMKQFKHSREYQFTFYNAYRHSLPGRMAVWSSAVITGGLLIYFIHQKVQK